MGSVFVTESHWGRCVFQLPDFQPLHFYPHHTHTVGASPTKPLPGVFLNSPGCQLLVSFLPPFIASVFSSTGLAMGHC